VKIELVPEPAPDDPAFRAATGAIEQTGLAADVRPAGNTSAWWRAGVHEAVELGIAPRGPGRECGREIAVGPHPSPTGMARHRLSRPDAPAWA
jgi:hypothetical protein